MLSFEYCAGLPRELDPHFFCKNIEFIAPCTDLYKYHRRKRPLSELDVPASRPAFHAPGRVLALRYFGETSRAGRLVV